MMTGAINASMFKKIKAANRWEKSSLSLIELPVIQVLNCIPEAGYVSAAQVKFAQIAISSKARRI